MADVRQPGRFQSFCAAGVPDSFFRERRRDLQGRRTGRRVLCCWPTFSSRRLPHQISTSPRTSVIDDSARSATVVALTDVTLAVKLVGYNDLQLCETQITTRCRPVVEGGYQRGRYDDAHDSLADRRSRSGIEKATPLGRMAIPDDIADVCRIPCFRQRPMDHRAYTARRRRPRLN